jgi:hypothetical protein
MSSEPLTPFDLLKRQFQAASQNVHRLRQELVAEKARADEAERRERDLRREMDRIRERFRDKGGLDRG